MKPPPDHDQLKHVFVLQKDGRTCPAGPVNYLIFAHRVDIRVVSLDVPYLIDVVLPLPPLKNALGVDVDTSTGKKLNVNLSHSRMLMKMTNIVIRK